MSTPYIPAGKCHVTIKNHLLFAAMSGFLLLMCVTHFSLYGLMSLVPIAGCMFVAVSIGFPAEEKPAHSLKYKSNHFLFFFVLGLAAVFLLHDLTGYADLAISLLSEWLSVVLILKGILACLLLLISAFIRNLYLKKTAHYVCVLCILWMVTGILNGNAAMYVLTVLLLLWFYFHDLCMIAETKAMAEEPEYMMAGAGELLLCGAAALFAFSPFQDAWMRDPAGMLEAVLNPVYLIYLLLTAFCMVLICAKFHPHETLSNNETAAFFTVFTALVLLKLTVALPFRFGFAVPVIYLLCSLPFLVSAGPVSALADFSDQVEIAPWVLHLLVSVQAVLAYLLLCSRLWICTVALIFSPYLLMTGNLFERLNNKRFRWHGYLAVIFAAFLALCADMRIFCPKAVVIALCVMLLLQAALWIWDDQFSAEKKALEKCRETADRLHLTGKTSEQHQKMLILIKSVMTAAYVLFSAVLLRKIM
ncbi:MAG: hypothetical protein IKQ91_00330 [Oscillospiraceae bacterium]|nr:hypothetical protein [Oscillospiraceae bacterium]